MLKSGRFAPIVWFVIVAGSLLTSLPKSVFAVEVVVNKSVPVSTFSLEDLQAVFSMQKRNWSKHRQIKVFILPESSQTHQDFVKHGLRMFSHQIRRIWDRMIYSGSGAPPVELSSEKEMINKIANTPDAIGYLSAKPDNENIRVINYH